MKGKSVVKEFLLVALFVISVLFAFSFIQEYTLEGEAIVGQGSFQKIGSSSESTSSKSTIDSSLREIQSREAEVLAERSDNTLDKNTVNGQVIKETGPNSQTASLCTDTDGGDIATEKGEVTIGSVSYEDECGGYDITGLYSSDGELYETGFYRRVHSYQSRSYHMRDSVTEYYCDANQVQSTTHSCQHGCYKGACITEDTEVTDISCTDLDDGFDYLTPSFVEYNYTRVSVSQHGHFLSNRTRLYVDDCASNGDLVELSCSVQGMLVYRSVDCAAEFGPDYVCNRQGIRYIYFPHEGDSYNSNGPNYGYLYRETDLVGEGAACVLS